MLVRDGYEKGWWSSDDAKKVCADIQNRERFLSSQLETPWKNMTAFWALYMGQRRDDRLPHEMWRAKLTVPYPLSVVETILAAISDLLNSSDPAIQAEAVGDEDRNDARSIERILDYTLRRNRWQGRTLDGLLRQMLIQGLTMPKLIWERQVRKIRVQPTRAGSRQADFVKRVREAELLSRVPAPDEPEEFAQWRETVNKAYPGKVRVPEMPVAGPLEVVQFNGPKIVTTSIYDLRYDPLVADIEDQELIIQRIVKSQDWLMQNTGREPGKMFDPDAVAACQGLMTDDAVSKWDQEIAAMIGIPNTTLADPSLGKRVELQECWRVGEDCPYMVILNRGGCINKTPERMPFYHAQAPYFPLRNVPMGLFIGQSEFAQTRPLFHEMNTHRELGLDAALLAVIPAFVKDKDMGLPEGQRALRPGMILDVARASGISQLNKSATELAMNKQLIDTIKQDIDESSATPPQMRGGASTVGRVSATETQQRYSQAMVRHKQRVLRVEDDLMPMVRQTLMLWYQFGDPQVVLNVGGTNPLVKVDRERFLDAMEMDFRFRGASKTLNKDMTVQQMLGFYDKFNALLAPPETRALMKATWEILGLKGGAEIVSDKYTAVLTENFEAQQAKPPAELPQAPDTVMDPATMQAMDSAATAPEQPAAEPVPQEA